MSPAVVTPVMMWFWRVPDDWAGSEGLNVAERERAGTYATAALRCQYEASVWFRRQVLGRVLDVPPQQIEFEVDARGKPALSAAQNPEDWRFNLAHSADAVLMAVVQGREVGVDIERVRPNVNWRGVAQTAFSALEREGVGGLPAFYSLWTAKEAYLKACGWGLGAPLLDISVQVRGPQIDVRSPLRSDFRQWWGWSFQPAPDVHAALMVERKVEDSVRLTVSWHTLKQG